MTTPTLSIYQLPASGSRTGTTAIVICPGGGYWNLAWDLEGEEVAARLNQSGITSCLLKYRVPRRPGEPESLPAKAPLLDAQRAIRMLRFHAAEWGIDPNRIGIVGFSAGGHLSIAAATHFDQNLYTAVDRADQMSSRPDFAIAVYPGYIITQERAGIETNRDQLAPIYAFQPRHLPSILCTLPTTKSQVRKTAWSSIRLCVPQAYRVSSIYTPKGATASVCAPRNFPAAFGRMVVFNGCTR